MHLAATALRLSPIVCLLRNESVPAPFAGFILISLLQRFSFAYLTLELVPNSEFSSGRYPNCDNERIIIPL